jgi:hypothetical protein
LDGEVCHSSLHLSEWTMSYSNQEDCDLLRVDDSRNRMAILLHTFPT